MPVRWEVSLLRRTWWERRHRNNWPTDIAIFFSSEMSPSLLRCRLQRFEAPECVVTFACGNYCRCYDAACSASKHQIGPSYRIKSRRFQRSRQSMTTNHFRPICDCACFRLMKDEACVAAASGLLVTYGAGSRRSMARSRGVGACPFAVHHAENVRHVMCCIVASDSSLRVGLLFFAAR